VRKTSTTLVPALVLLAGTVLVLGSLGAAGHASTTDGPFGKLPRSLDDLLVQALERNPEILIQQARLREAQAQLNQARLAVTQEVVRLHFRRQEQRKIIEQRSRDLQQVDQLYRAGSAQEAEVRKINIALSQAEGELAAIEADLRYAIGAGGAANLNFGAQREGPARSETPEEAPPAPVIPERIASVIDGPTIQVGFDTTPLTEVLAFLSQTSGLNFLMSPGLEDEDITVSISFAGPVTLRQLFHAIADVSDVSFAVREYGILAVYAGDHPEGSAVIPPYHD